MGVRRLVRRIERAFQLGKPQCVVSTGWHVSTLPARQARLLYAGTPDDLSLLEAARLEAQEEVGGFAHLDAECMRYRMVWQFDIESPFGATLSPMTPPEFLRAVLDLKGMTANGLARDIGMPTKQGSISKFLSGNVGSPRSDWAKAAAKFLEFNPAALRDPEVTEIEAARLGFGSAATGSSRVPPTPVRRLPQPQVRRTEIDPGMLVLQIADLMRGYSQSQRDLAGPLFMGAAKDPGEAPAIADAIRALLSGKRGVARAV